MIKKITIIILALVVLLLAGCTEDSPYPDDAYYEGDIYSDGDKVVTAADNLVTDMIVVGDGGINGVKDTTVSIDGFGNVDTNGGTLTVDDIFAENDVNITNDLDVDDDANVDGDLTVVGSLSVGSFEGNYGRRIATIKLIADGTALTTGDGKFYFPIPSELNGWNLVDADAMVSTVSTAGTPTYQIYNLTQTADMLSTRITIDANEYTSYTAATQPVIDVNNDDVATGDIIRIDKDVAGTGEKGDTIVLSFAAP